MRRDRYSLFNPFEKQQQPLRHIGAGAVVVSVQLFTVSAAFPSLDYRQAVPNGGSR